MSWKNAIKKEIDLNGTLGLVGRLLEGDDIWEYLDNPIITKKQFLDLIDQLQESIEGVSENAYEERQDNQSEYEAMRARESR